MDHWVTGSTCRPLNHSILRSPEHSMPHFFLLLSKVRMNLTTAWISSSFSLSAKAGIGVPFLPFLITSVISLSLTEACHLGFVKSGVLMAEKPLPSAPWHIRHFCL